MNIEWQALTAELEDAANFHDPIDIAGKSRQWLLDRLNMMLLIRCAEEKIGDWVTEGKAKCPCHLSIGQEAIAAGVCSNLRNTDRVFGTHRSHSHFLAMGCGIDSLMCEVLGKATGASRGMGGSMHLYGADHGFSGSVPIVGATIPLAVGAGLAAKMDKTGDVAAAFFGDGAAEEGVVHESLNLASKYSLPVLFVCENNLFASHLHVSLRQPCTTISRFASAHCIDHVILDGNDVCSVSDTMAEVLEKMRKSSAPFFLEAVTYRWRGHVGPREDVDVGVDRKHDLTMWKRRDPVRRLTDAMISSGILSQEELDVIEGEIRAVVAEAAVKAENDDYPDQSLLLDCVYAGGCR